MAPTTRWLGVVTKRKRVPPDRDHPPAVLVRRGLRESLRGAGTCRFPCLLLRAIRQAADGVRGHQRGSAQSSARPSRRGPQPYTQRVAVKPTVAMCAVSIEWRSSINSGALAAKPLRKDTARRKTAPDEVQQFPAGGERGGIRGAAPKRGQHSLLIYTGFPAGFLPAEHHLSKWGRRYRQSGQRVKVKVCESLIRIDPGKRPNDNRWGR